MASHPGTFCGPELRQLAQTILDRLDPAVRLAAARRPQVAAPGKCQQVWCPVCALAALVAGEQHPLLTVIAEHSVALLTVVRAMVDNPTGASRPTARRRSATDGSRVRRTTSRRRRARADYQHIPVTVEE